MQTRLARFRARKDRFFKTDPRSSLTLEQQQHVESLRYYPEVSALRFDMLLDHDAASHEPLLQTTSSAR